MLINRIIDYCDSEYKNLHPKTRCEKCAHLDGCSGGCKACLEEVHYPIRSPRGRRSYDCPHLINFYVCDYSYKYATEIFYLLQQSAALTQIENYRVFSIGCGGCPDLMAFEAYIEKNELNKTVEYRGIDKNPLWEPVHEQIMRYTTETIKDTHLSIEDAFSFFDQFCLGDTNVLVMQYIISALYSSAGEDAVEKLFDLVVESAVKTRDLSEPFVILINDVNSKNLGRDLFIKLKNKIKNEGIDVEFSQFYFDRNIKSEGQRYGTKHVSSRAMPKGLAEKYRFYEPWEFCTSAQLLIEIGRI